MESGDEETYCERIGQSVKGSLACEASQQGVGRNSLLPLEQGTRRVAVEVAAVSTPGREVVHIKNCLAAGYDQVFGIFADEALLVRTKQALASVVLAAGREKVRLLPLSKLSMIGEGE